MDRGVFQPAKLPAGHKAIGVWWVYAYKYHPDGSIIKGKEKACLVAQSFSQQPEDYGTTYAPVTKLTSIRIVLALAAKNDYEVLTYNVKTAFLHALLNRIIFCKHMPGFPVPSIDDGTPADVLQIIHASEKPQLVGKKSEVGLPTGVCSKLYSRAKSMVPSRYLRTPLAAKRCE